MPTLVDKVFAIDGIEFSSGSSEVSPSEVFDAFYEGLDPLIDFNINERSATSRRSNHRYELNQRKERALFKEWRESWPRTYHAKVTLEGGRKETFSLRARTDIETSFSKEEDMKGERTRRPNILFMEDEDGNAYVLRQAVAYSPESSIARKAQGILRNKADRKQYQKLFGDEEESLETGKYLVIPEPHLLAGLDISSTLWGTPKLTPEQRPVQAAEEENTVYMIRPYLDSIRSRPVGAERVATYLAGMHSLGLIDAMDRQKNHYCIQAGRTSSDRKGAVVNIDPDFWVHVGRYEQRLPNDEKEFFKVIEEMQQDVLEEDEDAFISYKRSKEKELGNHREDFLKILPTSMSDVKDTHDTYLLR